jgi:hypothetical protein
MTNPFTVLVRLHRPVVAALVLAFWTGSSAAAQEKLPADRPLTREERERLRERDRLATEAPELWNRGPSQDAEEIDDPLLQLMDRLRPHFQGIRAVRFAHQGD